MSDKWPAYELSSAAKSTTSKSRYVYLHIFLMSSKNDPDPSKLRLAF